jgi:hypothetical protein
MTAASEMPRYQSHKQVWALKIAAIEFAENGDAKIAPADAGFAAFACDGYRSKFHGDEHDLGYFVQYADGYKSWSPTEAFESGYTLINPDTKVQSCTTPAERHGATCSTPLRRIRSE